MREVPQWVNWKLVEGRKVPLNPKGLNYAGSTKPETWSTFEDAAQNVVPGGVGLGFVFTEEDDFYGIDIDDCVCDGVLDERAEKILAELPESYFEISPSGTGIKIFGTSTTKGKGRTGSDGLEYYTQGRFFTVTGDVIPGRTTNVLGDMSDWFTARGHGDTSGQAGSGTPKDSGGTQPGRLEPTDQDRDRALKYIATMSPSIEGENGSARLYHAACILLKDYAFSPGDAVIALLHSFNPRCQPPWDVDEIQQKVDWIMASDPPHRSSDYGCKLTPDVEGELLSTDEADEVAAGLLAGGVVNEFPKSLLRLPEGPMREFAEFSDAHNTRDVDVLNVAAAISWYAAVTGRKVRDTAGVRPNLYNICLAPSSGGKQAPQDCIRAVFDASNVPDTVAGKVTSDSAIGQILLTSPNALCIWDEVGLFFQKSKGGVMNTITDAMLELWGATNSRFRLKQYADNSKDIVIQSPCFSMIGFSTAQHFWAGMTRMHLRDGFAARLMVFDSGRRGERKRKQWCSPPKKLVDMVNWWNADKDTVYAIPVKDEAEDEFDKLLDYVDSLRAEDERAVWGRAIEKARKLAILAAVSRDPLEWEVTARDAAWGVEMASHTTEVFMKEAMNRLGADGNFLDIKNEVLEYLRQNGGVAKKTTVLQSVGCSKRAFDEVLTTLASSGLIKEQGRGNAKKVLLA